FDRLSQHFLRSTGRIDIGRVEQVDAGFEADIDEAACLFHVGRAPVAEQRAGAAERAGTEAQGRHSEAGCAEIAIFHDPVLSNYSAGARLALSGLLLSRRMARSATPSAAIGTRPATKVTESRPGPWSMTMPP